MITPNRKRNLSTVRFSILSSKEENLCNRMWKLVKNDQWQEIKASELKAGTQRDICTPVFTMAPFSATKGESKSCL